MSLGVQYLMTETKSKVRLKIEINGASVGPGKISLLEYVDTEGSISSAGRKMGMAYRRAWHLINTLQEAFDQPVICTLKGGSQKGGAELTPFGKELIENYREAELKAMKGSYEMIELLSNHLQNH